MNPIKATIHKLISIAVILLISNFLYGQLVINELDCDSPGIDDKEFIEIKSETPKFPLDGYILVLFNGSSSGGNTSYFNLDLNGYTTDINGLLLIGSKSLSPFPQFVISENIIQNGADAIAIYKSDTSAFPDRTLATQKDLIDALVYDTNDSDVESLMNLLGITVQINEGENGKKNTESIQRNNDGSYFVGSPTPRKLNDGTGIIQNGIKIDVENNRYNEGENINISFTLEQNVEEDFTFSFSLNNSSFNETDYTGLNPLTIIKGQNTANITISLIDDMDDEGDEVMVIKLDSLPEKYLALNDNIEIRIVDNDFKVANYGTPLNSTFGKVNSTQPTEYYTSLNGKSGEELKQELQNIISNPNIVRAQTYSDIIEILKEADQNPLNSNEVWMVYTEKSRAKLDFQTTSNNSGKWNREHTFPRSRGGFYSIKEDDIIDGIDTFWVTNADSLRHANSDAHALRVADGRENSKRGKKHYGEYTGPDGNKGSFIGDVARSVLYMAIRYNNLDIVKGFPNELGQLGDLDTILNWHRNDPPDDFEMNRNNIVYKWQFNRNPFIDYPELVEYIWGEKTDQIWDKSTDAIDTYLSKIEIRPNPTKGAILISNIIGETSIEILTITGKSIIKYKINSDTSFNLNLKNGTYLIKFTNQNKSITKRITVVN